MGSKSVSLCDIADLTPGFAFKSKEFVDSRQHVIKIGDIVPEVQEHNLPTVDVSRYSKAKLSKYVCARNDFLVAMTGNTIGKVGRMVSGTAYANQRVLKVTAKSDVVDPGFLWGVLLSRTFHDHIMSHIDSHSAQPNISAGSIGQFPVYLPDFEEQHKIASLLMSIETAIELNHRTNDYLAETVRVEFERRFGSETSTVDLGDVLTISTKSLKPSDCIGEVWEHYSIPAFDENHRPVFEPAEGIKSNKYIIDNNCILISKLNPSTKRLWLPYCTSARPVCSTEFIVYRPKRLEHKSFYYAAIDSPAFTDFLLAHVTGSTGSRQRTQPKATLSYPMPNPRIEEIAKFCEFANPLIAQQQLNEQESTKLERLRDTLLPKLMSGEIDVSQVELPTQPNNHLSAD